MAAVDPRVNDHMTRVQMRLLKQRIHEGHDAGDSSASTTPRHGPSLEQQSIALHQAMLRRQELMDKIKREKKFNTDFSRRPRSYAERRDRLTPPPSRRADSQPSYPQKQSEFGPGAPLPGIPADMGGAGGEPFGDQGGGQLGGGPIGGPGGGYDGVYAGKGGLPGGAGPDAAGVVGGGGGGAFGGLGPGVGASVPPQHGLAMRLEPEQEPIPGYDVEGGDRGDSPRHVIEHQFKPARLEPMENAPKPQYVQPQPLIISTPTMGDGRGQGSNTKAESSTQSLISTASIKSPRSFASDKNQAPLSPNLKRKRMPQPALTYQPAPIPIIVHNSRTPVVKARRDMYEFMMLQNAQMGQFMMQQMMMQHLPQPQQPRRITVTPGDVSPRVIEMMELMMMQNAQMHQMMMQQLMMSAIPKPKQSNVDLDEIINLKSDHRRPPSVHHHHYTPPPLPPPPQFPSYTLPPIQIKQELKRQPQPVEYPRQSPAYHPMPQPPPAMPSYYSPRYYDLEPLQQPKARKPKVPRYRSPESHPKAPSRVRHQSPDFSTDVKVKTPPPPPPPKKNYGPLPFPGPWALRKFRHAAYAAYFSRVVKNALKPNKTGPKLKHLKRLNEDFLFGIRLKEAVAALHHIYLNDGTSQPEKRINGILQQVIAENARDLTACFNDSGQDKNRAFEDLAVIIENIVYEVTEIMPNSGVLGTHKKAVVFDMLQNNRLYPRGYFWQIEKDLLNLDASGRTVNVTDYEGFILLTGMFIGRALVTTLMLKPVEYGLTANAVSYIGDKNLKLLATLFVYVCRQVYVPPNSKNPPPVPYEIGRFLYQDDDMQPVFRKLKKSFDYSEQLLRDWGSEYVKRLKAARVFSVSR